MKFLKIFLIEIIFFVFLCFITKTYSVEQTEGIDSFPDTYKPYLLELQNKHHNWSKLARCYK